MLHISQTSKPKEQPGPAAELLMPLFIPPGRPGTIRHSCRDYTGSVARLFWSHKLLLSKHLSCHLTGLWEGEMDGSLHPQRGGKIMFGRWENGASGKMYKQGRQRVKMRERRWSDGKMKATNKTGLGFNVLERGNSYLLFSHHESRGRCAGVFRKRRLIIEWTRRNLLIIMASDFFLLPS